MHEILTEIAEGRGPQTTSIFEGIGVGDRGSLLCQLGATAPNPVLSPPVFPERI